MQLQSVTICISYGQLCNTSTAFYGERLWLVKYVGSNEGKIERYIVKLVSREYRFSPHCVKLMINF